MNDISALIEQHKDHARPETTVDVCLAEGLAAEHQRLQGELEKVLLSPSTSLGDDRSEQKQALAEQIKAVEDEMRAATVSFRLRALGRKSLDDFRAGRSEDEPEFAFNVAITRACLIEPDLSDADVLALFGDNDKEGVLSEVQLNAIFIAVNNINFRGRLLPFSLAASEILSRSTPTSNSHGPSGSPVNGSTGGKKHKQRQSTATPPGT